MSEIFNNALNALLSADIEKVKKMIENGFDINSLDEEGNTLRFRYNRSRLWEYTRRQDGPFGGPSREETAIIAKRDSIADAFLDSLGAKTETPESKQRKQEIKDQQEYAREQRTKGEREQYLATLPPKGEILSIEEALKYEDKAAIKNLIAKGHNINKCDEYGNTLLEQYHLKWTNMINEIGQAEFMGRPVNFSNQEYQHIDRVISILNYFDAKSITEESKQIQNRRREEAIEKQKQIEEEKVFAVKKELNNSKLAKVRNKVAIVADKIAEATGTEKFVQKFTDGKKSQMLR